MNNLPHGCSNFFLIVSFIGTFHTKVPLNSISVHYSEARRNDLRVGTEMFEEKIIPLLKSHHISQQLLFGFGKRLNAFECVLNSVKSVGVWSFSGTYFPAFGLNTERYGVSLRT